ncbi:hypothetical protein CDN99_24520 [Roseateles aquatilis]|uniref:TIGR02270 family protein n=1 Tax=Roseateles aquatilis TaxID=431061 RepID=A0A246IWM1_9BURK|nr:TIGR02270 family protein [Roseateles aquatilis]OWQ84457.1 hypothetical protein CDN99_24520 [Roseateles aquatilis]
MQILGIAPAQVSGLINRRVLDEHAEDAAFLWRQREHAVRAPHYRLKHLALLDARVVAHLEGLRVGGVPGWEAARRTLADGEPGSAFVLAYLAARRGGEASLQTALQMTQAGPDWRAAVVEGLAWSAEGAAVLGPAAASLPALALHVGLTWTPPPERDSAVRTAVAEAATHPDPLLRAEGLRLLGETKRKDRTALLAGAMTDPDPACRFWAARSLALLGDAARAHEAFAQAREIPELAQEALEVAMRLGDPGWAREQIRALAADAGRAREAVMAAGRLGDPLVVPWLLDLLDHPTLARVAAESFAMITGIDLDLAAFKAGTAEPEDGGPAPGAAAPLAPEDGPEPHVDDEDLPPPAPRALRRWWSQERHRFVGGRRYLVGRAIDTAVAVEVLRNGYQRQRQGAALELARLRPGARVFSTRSRADWQRRWLAPGDTA